MAAISNSYILPVWLIIITTLLLILSQQVLINRSLSSLKNVQQKHFMGF